MRTADAHLPSDRAQPGVFATAPGALEVVGLLMGWPTVTVDGQPANGLPLGGSEFYQAQVGVNNSLGPVDQTVTTEATAGGQTATDIGHADLLDAEAARTAGEAWKSQESWIVLGELYHPSARPPLSDLPASAAIEMR